MRKAWNKGKKLGSYEEQFGKEKASEIKDLQRESHRGSRHWNWKGGRSEIWYRKLLAESGREKKCHYCQSVNQIEIHHLNQDHYDNRLENLVYACKECHERQHEHKSWLKGKKLEELPLKLQETLKSNAIKKGQHLSQSTEFKKGMTPWWKKAGFNSSKDAIVAKRGYWLEKTKP